MINEEIDLAADTLHKVLNNPSLQEINENKHSKIIEEAQNYGLYLKSIENENNIDSNNQYVKKYDNQDGNKYYN